jgi:sugar/nucleoside kinase (ribokinase family)
MLDVVALGEVLIDFTPVEGEGNPQFQQNPGGAPANVCAALAKLGRKTAFLGKVGQDQFGRYLRDVLDAYQIETKGLKMSEETRTTLAFVHLDKQGDRSFSFYRNPGADQMLTVEDLDLQLIDQAKFFHFGSLSMTHDPARTATWEAIRYAQKQGKRISYDPNLRPALWPNLDEARDVILSAMPYADVVKISDEELEFLTGTQDLVAGTRELYKQSLVPLICVTLGANGCFYRSGDMVGTVEAFPVQAVDTTGAGDGFLAGLLHGILNIDKQLPYFSVEELQSVIRFANAVGALATTRKGAIPAMPTLAEAADLLK